MGMAILIEKWKGKDNHQGDETRQSKEVLNSRFVFSDDTAEGGINFFFRPNHNKDTTHEQNLAPRYEVQR